MKNPDVSCWHGETSAVMRLGGHVPEGGCVFSTLKPCKMCAGLIHDAGNGTVKAFYGQDDPVQDAQSTALDKSRMGAALDAHKGLGLPSGIVFARENRSEEHTSQLQYLQRISSPVFCLTQHKT